MTSSQPHSSSQHTFDSSYSEHLSHSRRSFLKALGLAAGTSLFTGAVSDSLLNFPLNPLLNPGSDSVSSPFESTALAQSGIKTKLRILLIGNSFSYCLPRYFPGVVRSVPPCDILLDKGLTEGGATLEDHCIYIEEETKNKRHKHYGSYSYAEKLASQPWDIVSIQQGSPLSWDPDSFSPWTEKLAIYIQKYAPTAEIILQQTWSYRFDDERLQQWDLTQKSMTEKIRDAYAKIAKKIKARVIPVGEAIQLARDTQPGGYPKYNSDDYKYPNLPDNSKYLTGSFGWDRAKKSVITPDTYHLNRRGEYLQACVWFALLYRLDPMRISFVPKELTAKDALFLRQVAHKTAKGYKQPAFQSDEV